MNNFQGKSVWKPVTFRRDQDDVRFVLDQRASFDFYSAISLKQQSAGWHVYSDRLTLIPRTPVFDRTTYCCMLSEAAATTNFIVFGLTRLGLESLIRCEHAKNYTTDVFYAVSISLMCYCVIMTMKEFGWKKITWYIFSQWQWNPIHNIADQDGETK